MDIHAKEDMVKKTKIKNKIEHSGIKDELLAHYYRPENAHKFMERGDVSVDFVERWK